MNSVGKQTLPFPDESLWLLWKLLAVLFDRLNSVSLQLVGSLSWNRSHQNDERQRTQWKPFIRAIYHKVEYRWYLVRNSTLPPSFVIHSKKKKVRSLIDAPIRNMSEHNWYIFLTLLYRSVECTYCAYQFGRKADITLHSWICIQNTYVIVSCIWSSSWVWSYPPMLIHWWITDVASGDFNTL